MFLRLAISAILTAIKESFKNPKKKEELKTAFLEIRDQINALYPPEDNPK